MAATTNIDMVKGLRAFSSNLRGATERWRSKYSDRQRYDKQGFQFGNYIDDSL